VPTTIVDTRRTTAVVMLADQYEYVIGGDPDRDTIDLAVIATATGVVRGYHTGRADGPGYRRLINWALRLAPGRRVWALEGTGSFAAGLAAALAELGEDVVEVNGGKRRRGAKNDRLDAVRAAVSRWLVTIRPSPAAAACGRLCGRFSLPDKRFWSAAPKRSTSSRA
jgi:transposase